MGNDSTTSRGQSSTATTEIADEEMFERVVADADRLLVDFYADWCGPCQTMAPTVEELASETPTEVVKVNVEEVPLVAYRYDVRSIPTYLEIADEDVVDRLEGIQEKEDLEQLVE